VISSHRHSVSVLLNNITFLKMIFAVFDVGLCVSPLRCIKLQIFIFIFAVFVTYFWRLKCCQQ